MTIREKMQERLVEHDLWPDEANMVISNAIGDKSLDAMKGRWDETTEGYPPQLLAVVWMSVKSIALDWIKANKPMHFARLILER